MDTAQKCVIAVVLVLVGAGLWVFVAKPLTGPREKDWDVAITQNAIELTQVIRPDPWPEDLSRVDPAWGKRRDQYDEVHFAKLRDKLNIFVDFEVSEYADAKDIYISGSRPEKVSSRAAEAREKLKAAFPDHADEMIKQFHERVREEAYKASPKVGGGVDPDLTKFDVMYDVVIADWLPKARARIAELTKR